MRAGHLSARGLARMLSRRGLHSGHQKVLKWLAGSPPRGEAILELAAIFGTEPGAFFRARRRGPARRAAS
jgi:hypothetical protein